MPGSMASTPDQAGIPTDWVYDGAIASLNVRTNALSKVSEVTDDSGRIEFWSHAYTANPGSTFDSDDTRGAVDEYGSLQVRCLRRWAWPRRWAAEATTFPLRNRPLTPARAHAPTRPCMQLFRGSGSTLLAVNGWARNGTLDVGIGDGVSPALDWTGAANAGAFSTRTLKVLTMCPRYVPVTVQEPSGGPIQVNMLRSGSEGAYFGRYPATGESLVPAGTSIQVRHPPSSCPSASNVLPACVHGGAR